MPPQRLLHHNIEHRHIGKYENSIRKPPMKKVYVKANGDSRGKRPNLFKWKRWQSPTLDEFCADVAPYVDLDTATAIFDINGRRITSENHIRSFGTYYIVGNEERVLYVVFRHEKPKSSLTFYHNFNNDFEAVNFTFSPDSGGDYEEEYYKSRPKTGRVTSMSVSEIVPSRECFSEIRVEYDRSNYTALQLFQIFRSVNGSTLATCSAISGHSTPMTSSPNKFEEDFFLW
uniref:Doublecortin domain-containing protein n=1 Tax=Angiostrongylus cantonensis TaxID=6313 RepID=A0A0K0DNN1_ANGCA